jgi:hypothetical protein
VELLENVFMTLSSWLDFHGFEPASLVTSGLVPVPFQVLSNPAFHDETDLLRGAANVIIGMSRYCSFEGVDKCMDVYGQLMHEMIAIFGALYPAAAAATTDEEASEDDVDGVSHMFLCFQLTRCATALNCDLVRKTIDGEASMAPLLQASLMCQSHKSRSVAREAYFFWMHLARTLLEHSDGPAHDARLAQFRAQHGALLQQALETVLSRLVLPPNVSQLDEETAESVHRFRVDCAEALQDISALMGSPAVLANTLLPRLQQATAAYSQASAVSPQHALQPGSWQV